MESSERFLTPPRIARILRCGNEQVLEWIRSGELRAINLSGSQRPRWKVDPADLKRFLAARSNQASASPPRRNVRKPQAVKEFV